MSNEGYGEGKDGEGGAGALEEALQEWMHETAEKYLELGFEPDGPTDPLDLEQELAKVVAMGANARGVVIQDGRPTGQLVDINVQVENCTWEGEAIPAMRWVRPNSEKEGGEPLYFFRAYSFHPGTQRSLAEAPAPDAKDKRIGKIIVVDTGWRDQASAPPGTSALDIDPITNDLIAGHGPAIVDIIEHVGGTSVDVQLMQVRFGNVIPVFIHPNIPGEFFRGFPETALEDTLNELRGQLNSGDVINLSLGTIFCEGSVDSDDRIGPLLEQVIDARDVSFVVAAGNHGNEVPSWPAAHGRLGLRLSRVHAVGSGTPAIADDFSARGGWVGHWEDGSDVGYDPQGTMPPGVGKSGASWSGTSFAAPQFAVELLPRVPVVGPIVKVPDDGQPLIVDIRTDGVLERLLGRIRQLLGR